MVAPAVAAYFKSVGYEPFRDQWLFHDSMARFRIATCGRRFGKSTMAARDCVPKHLLKPDKLVWCVGPTYDLAEKEFRVIWQDLIIKKKLGRDKRVKKGYNKRSGTMFINLPWNTNIECRSAEHPDLLVGEALDHVIMCEAAKHKKETWDRFIRPSLTDRRGSADFPTTPEGFNWLYETWQLGRDPDLKDYASWKFPSWHNTKVFPGGREDPEILLLEKTMTPEWFLQEIGADFASFVGKIFPEWDEFMHVRPHSFRPAWKNYIAFDWGYCVDEETEILTQQGWKRYDALREGDLVLTQNPTHGLSEWQPVESVHTFQGTFDMRLMEHSQHSSLSTSNHRWVVQNQRLGRWKTKTTDEVTKSDFVASALPCSNLPEVAKYKDSFVEVVGWYWTEGSVHNSGGIQIWQSETANPFKCARIRSALEGVYPGQWKEYGHNQPGLRNFWLRESLAKEIKDVAPGKVVSSEFIASLTKAQLQLFVEVSLMADGWTTNGGSRCIGQKVLNRIHPLQMACSLLGIATTVKQQKDGQWRLTLLSRNHVYPKYKEPLHVVHEGTVWCPTTRNGTWFARRKGTTYFTHNTNPLAAVEFQVSPSDQIFVWRLFYKSYWTVRDVARYLGNQAQPEGYHLDLCFGDPADPEAVVNMTNELGTAVWAPPSLKNDYTWRDGIDLMRQFMKADREIGHDEYGTPEYEPSFFVDPSCRELIKEFSNYRSKAPVKGANVPELGAKVEDHTIDAMRYALLCIYKIGCQHSLDDSMVAGDAVSHPGYEREFALVSATQGGPGEYDMFGESGSFLGSETGTFTQGMVF